MNAPDLLKAYRDHGSEEALVELIRWHGGFVFAVARRRLGATSLAEDVTQTVFHRLAKSPPRLSSEAELIAWLHRTTIRAAIDTWRMESRRRNREQEAALLQPPTADESNLWQELAPELDSALDALGNSDRQALLLRFFECQSMREVGRAFGVSEDAAKMRVSRALDRLRGLLAARGVTCGVALLATLLAERSSEAMPAALAGKLDLLARSGHWAGSSAGQGWLASVKPAIVACAGLLAVVALIFLLRPRAEAPVAPAIGAEQSRGPARETAASRGFRFEPRNKSGRPISAPRDPGSFTLRVVERGTGRGVPGVMARAAYFYAGGVGERHEVQTGADGTALVPGREHPDTGSGGLNLFLRCPGYVPVVLSLRDKGKWVVGDPDDAERVVELEPARDLGGLVVNEEGQPVAGAVVRANRAEKSREHQPNVDFQLVKVVTDERGEWSYPYVPQAYTDVQLSLTHSNYAVTVTNVVLGSQPQTVLVVRRGFVVAGTVTDDRGLPLSGATVEEVHNFGERKLSVQTDASGRFRMAGVSDVMGNIREFVAKFPGRASQFQAVELGQPAREIDFVMAASPLFQGRVVDEAGQPIAHACVRTDMDFVHQIHDRYEWLDHTDAAGRFLWDSAPAETLYFWFEAPGYEVIRAKPLLPNGQDYEIKLVHKAARQGTTINR